MSGKKSPTLKMILVLFIVCLLAAAALGVIWLTSVEKIEENERKVMEEAVFKVIPGIEEFERISTDPLAFKGLLEGEVKGYAFRSAGIGFQGEIVLMVGMDKNMEKLTGVDVVQTVETPGLGDRIREEEFLKQFREMKIPDDRNIEVDGITGATMSSDAVENIVEKSIKDAEERIH